MEDVELQLFGQVDLVHQCAKLEDGFEVADCFDFEQRFRFRHALQDLVLFLERGILDHQLKHKPIDLCFRQFVCAFLFDGILRGEDEERQRQQHGFFPKRRLFLLHGFEQSALNLCRRAVDFIGQKNVGEDRPALCAECRGLRVVDERADQVTGEQVWRELHTAELGIQALGKHIDRQRFCHAGDALDKDMAIAEQCQKETIDQALLSNNYGCDLLSYFRKKFSAVVDALLHYWLSAFISWPDFLSSLAHSIFLPVAAASRMASVRSATRAPNVGGTWLTLERPVRSLPKLSAGHAG